MERKAKLKINNVVSDGVTTHYHTRESRDGQSQTLSLSRGHHPRPLLLHFSSFSIKVVIVDIRQVNS